jgi:uncharacterized protein YjbI with pentapeptide repeats
MAKDSSKAKQCTDCLAPALTAGAKCFSHSRQVDRDSALREVNAGGKLWFCRNLELSNEILSQILLAAPRSSGNLPILRDADFTGAIFDDFAQFWIPQSYPSRLALIFDGPAIFTQAVFKRGVDFESARFNATADFTAADFIGSANFDDCTFAGGMSSAHFVRQHDATRSGDWDLERARERAHYSMLFINAVFRSSCGFGRVYSKWGARFDHAIFSDSDWWGPLHCTELFMSGVHFSKRSRLILHGVRARSDFSSDTEKTKIHLDSAEFKDGIILEANTCDLELSRISFDGPVVIRATPRISEWADTYGLPAEADDERPRVVTLTDCNIAGGLTFTNVDLSMCAFRGSTNLDRLRLETGIYFYEKTGFLHTRRRLIAEECVWRLRTDRNWTGPSGAFPNITAQAPFASMRDPSISEYGAEALQIAETYRALRKGREDNKDEPGAADFYYGEMEMRRRSALTPLPERWLLTAYWIFSGYGLRAARAFSAFLIVIFIFSILFTAYGFRDWRDPYGSSRIDQQHPGISSLLSDTLDPPAPIAYSLGTATSIINGPDAALTIEGEFMRVALRVIGPSLLGLGVFAMRGRIKR